MTSKRSKAKLTCPTAKPDFLKRMEKQRKAARAKRAEIEAKLKVNWRKKFHEK